jgi:hypothetical protein
MSADMIASIKNEEQRRRFEALLLSALAGINEIDAATVADPRWPNDAPDWWTAMSRLRDECYRAKARL